jgi:hypothetical protein
LTYWYIAVVRKEQTVTKTRRAEYVTAMMTSEDPPPLSPQRAFVVQFRVGAGAEPGRFVGRVEHMTSAQATRFASLEDLVAFLMRVLAEVGE